MMQLSHLVIGVLVSASLAHAQRIPVYLGPCPAGAADPLANTTWAFQASGNGAAPTAEIGTFSVGVRNARSGNNSVTFNLTANAGGGIYRADSGVGSLSYLCQTGTSTVYAGTLQLADGLAGQIWQMRTAPANVAANATANTATNAAALSPLPLSPTGDLDLCPNDEPFGIEDLLSGQISLNLCPKRIFALHIAEGFLLGLQRGYATKATGPPPQGPTNFRSSLQAANSVLAPAASACPANPYDLLAQNAPFGYQFAAASVEGSVNAVGGLVNGQNVSNRLFFNNTTTSFDPRPSGRASGTISTQVGFPGTWGVRPSSPVPVISQLPGGFSTDYYRFQAVNGNYQVDADCSRFRFNAFFGPIEAQFEGVFYGPGADSAFIISVESVSSGRNTCRGPGTDCPDVMIGNLTKATGPVPVF